MMTFNYSFNSTSVPELNNNEDYYFFGWICPKCGRVYNPMMMMCTYCVPITLDNTNAYR